MKKFGHKHAGRVPGPNITIRCSLLTIQPTLLIESNYKTVNTIYFYALVHGVDSHSTSQINVLHNISHQCPLSGGKAVFMARYLLEILTDSIAQYPDDCNGYVAARKYKNNLPVTSPKVYVNVVNDKINVRFENKLDSPAIFYLYNSLGVCTVTQELSKGFESSDLDVFNHSSGIYFYKILYNGKGYSSTGKIIITK